MKVHLVNPSHVSFGTAVITPRWLYVLASATPRFYGDPLIVDETISQVTPESIGPGDVVGIGIHTGNALRGYEIGKMARERGAWVVFGGIHATLYSEEAQQLGGAHAVVKGDGDRRLGHGARRLRQERAAADLLRRPRRGVRFRARTLGSCSPRPLYVGFGADRARLPEALLVLLGLAHRRPAPAATRVRRGHRGDRPVAPAAASASSRSPTIISIR